MAGRRHPPVVAAGRQLYRDHRAAAGAQDRLPRGDLLPQGLHRRRAARSPGGPDEEELLRTVPARAPQRRRTRDVNVIETDLPGVLILEPRVFGDDRGFFMESWNGRRYEELGIPGAELRFVQDNLSFSAHGVLRGLHFQNPQPQGKLASVLRGEVFAHTL